MKTSLDAIMPLPRGQKKEITGEDSTNTEHGSRAKQRIYWAARGQSIGSLCQRKTKRPGNRPYTVLKNPTPLSESYREICINDLQDCLRLSINDE
jgi:hypothetical protein